MKFLIDTDIGSDVDDAFALYALLKLVPNDVIGITTVYGNACLRAKISQKLVNSMCLEIPVICGENTPIYSPENIWLTGYEGKEILTEEEFQKEFKSPKSAPEFIVEQIEKHKNNISIIAIGPLTNIAKALEINPEIKNFISNFYFMGGAIYDPNPIPPVLKENKPYRAEASHNIKCDVGAAKKVIKAIPNIKFITNDVSHKATFSRRKIEKFLKKYKNDTEWLLAEMLKVWLDYKSKIYGYKIKSTVLHDVLTVAEALNLNFIDYLKGDIEILDNGETKFYYKKGSHLFSYKFDDLAFKNWLYDLLGI